MRAISRTFLAASLVLASLTACSGDDDDGGPGVVNASPIVSAVIVTDARTSPAQISFLLTDEESDPAEVELVFFPLGGGAQPLTLVGNPDLSALATDPNGQLHTFQWDFDADAGSSFQEGVQLRADLLDGVQMIVSSATASPFAIGNDAPTVAITNSPGGSGDVVVEFNVADSSDDLVNVLVEFDVIGDVPDAGFQTARPAALPPTVPTPAFSYVDITALRTGVDLMFSWDTEFDVPGFDGEVQLRIRADDDLESGIATITPGVFVDNNASAMVTALSVTDTRESPATVTFELLDMEADPQSVELFFVRPGSSTREPMTVIGSVLGLGADAAGTQHVVEWDFATDLGSTGFATGFNAALDVREGSNTVSTLEFVDFGVGNDAPIVDAAFGLPLGEVTGNADVTFRVSDSTADLVDVAVEYDVIGDVPDAGFVRARPAGLAPGDPTPLFAFMGVASDPAGVDLSFTWDVVADEGTTDFEAVLRFTPADDLEFGLERVSPSILLDNNESARAELDPSFVSNTDGLRGIPVPFTVVDPEGDTVELLFQWRLDSQSFPQLPTDVDDVRAALADPVQRRALQIATEYRPIYTGRTLLAANDPSGDAVRLPELAGPAAAAVAGGVEGLVLEILDTNRSPEPTGNPWTLASPVSALTIGEGPEVIVLDEPIVGSWRLRSFDLATGAELRTIASGSEGSPSVMDFRRGGAPGVVFAAGDGTLWSLLGVDLATGQVSVLVGPSVVPTSGTVRGVASLDAERVMLTVGTALVEARDGGSAFVLLDDFTTPWGVAPDPRDPARVFVAERGNPSVSLSTGALYSVDVTTLQREEVAGGRVRPRALAAAADGTGLYILGDLDPNNVSFQLLSLDFGGAPVSTVAGPFGDDRGGVASSGSSLLVALPGDGDLASSGGVRQRRQVASYQTAAQVATVDAPFDPAITTGEVWRLRESLGAKVSSATGETGTFVWDSTDVAQGGDVVLRAVALDTDVGEAGADSQTPRRVASPLDVDGSAFGSGDALEPVAVASADFDRDGNLDVVTANAGGEDLTVFLQPSVGTFAGGTSLAMGAGSVPSDVVTADFNGDGLPDLAASDAVAGVRVFSQTGPGTFGPPLDVPGSGVRALVAGDVDRDGLIDLVVGGSTTVAVHRGTPTGLMATPDQEITSGVDDVRALAIADVGGDGENDLVVGSAGSDLVSIFDGPDFTGMPTDLAAPSAGAEPSGIDVRDLDGDGRLDVAAAYRGADSVGVFFQDLAGGFTAPAVVLGDSATTAAPAALRLADLDGDGDADLAAAVASGRGVAVFFQTSPGTFATTPDLDLGVSGSTAGATDLLVRDVDGDGRVDVLSTAGSANELALVVQARPGDFRSETLSVEDPSTTEDPVFVEPGDFNGDGRLDLAVANRTEDHVTFYFQDEPGVFAPSPNGPVGAGSLNGATGLASGDLDGDGDLDLVVAATGKNGVGILIQDPAGVFTVDAIVGSGSTSFRPRAVVLADFDQDGALDIASANTGGGTVTIFRQTAPGTFSTSPTVTIGGGVTFQPNSILARDLDGDGDLDIATANRGNLQTGEASGVGVFLRVGSGFVKKPTFGLTTGLPSTMANDLAAGDLNGDGDLDLIYADRGAGLLAIFDQRTPGNFGYTGTMLTDPLAPIEPIWVEVADVNGDGRDDVVAVDSLSSRVLVFVQDRAGEFRLERLADLRPADATGAPVTVRAADLDGDGDLDLVTADSVSGKSTIHFGGR